MCGFCGIVGPTHLAAIEDLDAMTRELVHRGPDDLGTWSAHFKMASGEHAVALGHTRLSILDLSALGHQPMQTADGSVTISYNGEIYNFRELREELRAHGHTFRSETDTEVLLEAYCAWGVDAFTRLIGMFAFAIWDARQQRLLLVRDRLGIKPLYYCVRDGVLTFGSELRALRRHRGFEPRLDRGALGRYLRYGYVTGVQTIYANVWRVMPGEYLIWEGGKIETRPYWRLVEEADARPPASFEAAVDRLEELLGDAVERQLIADVPIGAFLSGGVDSSLVVALMRERTRSEVRTFSIGFCERPYDEAPFARKVAEHLGTQHTELYVERHQALSVAHELPTLYDEPFADESAIPTTLLCRLARNHVTVALSGDGGDEIFGGYERYTKFSQLLPLFALPRTVRRLLAAAAPLVPRRSVRNGLSHLMADDHLELAERLHSHFETAELRAGCGEEGARPSDVFADTFATAPTDDPIARMRFGDCRMYLCDDILTKVDRASMSVALEVRVPILDHRVVQFGMGLPRSLVWYGGETKAPLRAMLYRRVPRELIERPKCGFGIPIETLLARELEEWPKRHLNPARLAEEGIFQPDGVALLLARAQSREPIAVRRLWFLICFQRWFAWNHRGECDT